MASEQQRQAIKGSKVLMVGAGGIGCELLKTLALSGFQDIHIVQLFHEIQPIYKICSLFVTMEAKITNSPGWVPRYGSHWSRMAPYILQALTRPSNDPTDHIDMDTIEVSNLNRQFLFRQAHVGQSKAKVARDAVLRFRPNINITPYHANVKDPEFNVDFFKQFNVVLNGLDNLDARRHVNRLCLAADVPLVESGTTGFLGQVTVHVKGKTECYECQPKPTPKTYPVCTITSTPSKFVHCIVWAKDLLFAKLFGDRNQENDLNVRSSNSADPSKQAEDVFERIEGEDAEQYGRRVYDHVFGYNIEVALTNEETWKNRDKPKPIYIKDVLPPKVDQQNGNIDANCTGNIPTVSAMSPLGLKNPQEIWSLLENTRIFLEAIKLFIEKREQEIGSLAFDKDDQLAVEFVTAAANIRASSFGIPMHSLFEAKGMAGNIVHAVATTNAVIAGLIVIETIKVLQGDASNYRMTYCVEHPLRKMLLMPVDPFEPNKSCYVCSETPLSLEVNTQQSKLRDFVEKIVKNKLGMNSPLIMQGSTLIFEVGDDLEEDMAANYAANLDKVLADLPAPVTSGTILTVEDLQQELSCSINIKHREEFDEEREPDGMVLTGWTSAPAENSSKAVGNGESTSNAPENRVEDQDDSDEIEVVTPQAGPAVSGKKRPCLEIPNASGPCCDQPADEEDLVIFDGKPDIGKKKRLQ